MGAGAGWAVWLLALGGAAGHGGGDRQCSHKHPTDDQVRGADRELGDQRMGWGTREEVRGPREMGERRSGDQGSAFHPGIPWLPPRQKKRRTKTWVT